MDWPSQPVEQRDPTGFVPPFCPWPACRSHRPDRDHQPRFHRHGTHTRQAPPHRVPRFRCLECGRTCSQQTFSTTYYLKRPELLAGVAANLNAGSAHRQIGRSLGCAGSTVTGLAARLGRHALLFHARSLEHLGSINEAVVYDDFESFAHSQDLPFGLGTAVGQRSWFVYSLQFTPHRRGGPPRRRKRRSARKFNPPKGNYGKTFQQTLDILLAYLPESRQLEIVSDGHKGYQAGLRKHPQRQRVLHRIYPNPKRGRPDSWKRHEQMFAADLTHKLIRHSTAHHKRETIAFGQRHNALLERAFLMTVWRNFLKRRSERKPSLTTPAMFLGLTDHPWEWSEILAQRLFPSHARLPEEWRNVYWRRIATPEIGVNLPHQLAHAA